MVEVQLNTASYRPSAFLFVDLVIVSQPWGESKYCESNYGMASQKRDGPEAEMNRCFENKSTT